MSIIQDILLCSQFPWKRVMFLGQDGSMYRGWKLKVRRLPHLLRTIDNKQYLLRFMQMYAFMHWNIIIVDEKVFAFKSLSQILRNGKDLDPRKCLILITMSTKITFLLRNDYWNNLLGGVAGSERLAIDVDNWLLSEKIKYS